jgi:hypothetical protein
MGSSGIVADGPQEFVKCSNNRLGPNERYKSLGERNVATCPRYEVCLRSASGFDLKVRIALQCGRFD